MPIFVDSNATGGLDDGTSPADAFLLFQSALTAWITSTDYIAINSDPLAFHQESTGTVTYNCPNATDTLPCRVVSVDFNDLIVAEPHVGVVGSVQLDATSSMTLNVNVNYEGVSFQADGNFFANQIGQYLFLDCYMACNGLFGNTANETRLDFVGTTMEGYGASLGLRFNNSRVFFVGCVFTGTVVSGGLFQGGIVRVRASDFLGLESGASLVESPAASRSTCLAIEGSAIDFGDLVLPSFNSRSFVRDIASDNDGVGNGAKWLATYRDLYGVSDRVDTTFMDNGQVDVEGGNVAHRYVSGSDISLTRPLKGPVEVIRRIDTTGAITVRVELAHDFTSLNQTQMWVDLLYYPDTDSARLARVSSRVLQSVGLPSSSELWTNAAGFTIARIDILVTIAEVGVMVGEIYLGAFESGRVLYVNPDLIIV